MENPRQLARLLSGLCLHRQSFRRPIAMAAANS
jgi:hypothetical protein